MYDLVVSSFVKRSPCFQIVHDDYETNCVSFLEPVALLTHQLTYAYGLPSGLQVSMKPEKLCSLGLYIESSA